MNDVVLGKWFWKKSIVKKKIMVVNDINKYMFYIFVYILIVLFYFRLILLLMKYL